MKRSLASVVDLHQRKGAWSKVGRMGMYSDSDYPNLDEAGGFNCISWRPRYFTIRGGPTINACSSGRQLDWYYNSRKCNHSFGLEKDQGHLICRASCIDTDSHL